MYLIHHCSIRQWLAIYTFSSKPPQESNSGDKCDSSQIDNLAQLWENLETLSEDLARYVQKMHAERKNSNNYFNIQALVDILI